MFPENPQAVATKILLPILLLLFPAMLINLNEERVIDDESLRNIVALEMIISGDYLTPTIAGDYYYKKPPVFNWLIAAGFRITGAYNEWTPRGINLLFLLVFSATVMIIVKRHYGWRTAYLTGLLFLTSSRILLYESLYGLIDITFSWLIFLNFYLIYRFTKDKKYYSLFFWTYFITGVTFLMKGIPAIAFQGISLIVGTILTRSFKKLFSLPHLLGFCVLLCMAGGYYFAYAQRNPEEIGKLLQTIYSESADKSAVSFGLGDIVLHIFSYSFEILYNYVPGTLVVFFFFKKQPLEIIKKDKFLRYLGWILIANIVIYLVSPQTYMRYVLMFVPIITLFFIVHYLEAQESGLRKLKYLDLIFLMIPILLFLGMPAFALVDATNFVPFPWLVVSLLMLSLLWVIGGMLKAPRFRLEYLIAAMLIMRIAFNWFVLPSRTHNHWQIHAKEESIRIAKEYVDLPMYRLNGPDLPEWDLPTPLVFYMSAERKEIIQAQGQLDQPGYYLIQDTAGQFSELRIDSLRARPDRLISVLKYPKSE